MRMGKSFLFFILLLGSTTLAITDSQQKFLDEVNEAREKYADEYNIPNMHKLVWSDDLQEILKTLNFKGEWPYSRIIWRFTVLDSYEGVTQVIDDEMKTFLSKTDKEAALKAGTLLRLELLNPLQTVLVCGTIPDGDADEKKLVCLVGPEGQGKLWDVENKPSEPAGSKCPHHYHNENGLCVPDDPSEISLFGFQDDFLTEVNELRREYAKLYNVPNMHQLVWNEELVKIVDPLKWNAWPFSRKMWRFCALLSYHKQNGIIKRELDEFIPKSAEQRKSALNSMSTSTMSRLEMLSPRQSEIGCVQKWVSKNTISIICLVGTIGQAELWDFDTKSTEEPGSACPENYKNDDGLCIPVDPTPISIYGNPQDFLKELNDVRRRYAKEYKIPNMHQLVWSEDLVKISELLDLSVSSGPSARITWRFSRIWSYRNIFEDIEDYVGQILRKTEDEIPAWIANKQSGSAVVLELLNPLQTVVGCAEKTDTVTVLLCLIGSEGSLTAFDFTKKSSAVPGSTCSNHYKNEDGLCVPVNAADVSYFGFREDFLSGVNELRRSIAKQYQIPNMHQLVWNEELVKIIDPINWKGDWPFARRMWRFCVFVSYQKQIDLIKKELDVLIGKSAEQRKSELAGMNTSRMGKLEVLNPRQSEIGCVRKWTDSNTISIVCLVGTRGLAELWDFDAKSTEEPGSACPENYKNNDGLCIPVDPTPVSIYGNRQDFMKQLNDVRRRYAKEYKIPNMHQLVWSEDLVKISEPLDLSAPSSARITWRFSQIWSYRNIIEYIDDIVEQLNMKTDEKRTEWIAGKQKDSARELELLNPLQTVVGCAEKTDKVTVLLCLIGSEGSLTAFDFTKKSSAVPGSTCSKNYKNEDGLCVPDNAADVSYFGYREDFLSGVNELRRSIAKQYHIPNMHELKWHEDFVGTAQSDSWPSDHPSWRYTKIKSYRDLKTIEDEVNGFISKNDDEKKSFVTDNESLNGLELMNPEQTLIGCGKKKGEDNALTCLIGTQGTWPEVTFDSNSEVAPGSKCLKDYENTDGLCTFFSPTPPPPKKVIPQGGAPQRIERVTQRIPEAAAQQSDEKDEPDTATTKFSSYLMISFSIILFLY